MLIQYTQRIHTIETDALMPVSVCRLSIVGVVIVMQLFHRRSPDLHRTCPQHIFSLCSASHPLVFSLSSVYSACLQYVPFARPVAI
jgi:hypothetical protein